MHFLYEKNFINKVRLNLIWEVGKASLTAVWFQAVYVGLLKTIRNKLAARRPTIASRHTYFQRYLYTTGGRHLSMTSISSRKLQKWEIFQKCGIKKDMVIMKQVRRGFYANILVTKYGLLPIGAINPRHTYRFKNHNNY